MRTSGLRLFVLVAMVLVLGCGPKKKGGTAKKRVAIKEGDVAATVRAVLAEHAGVESATIPMDEPVGGPPLKIKLPALAKIVLELEEMYNVDISGDDLDRMTGYGRKGDRTAITPNQLVALIGPAAAGNKKSPE